jgi:hypothetical protein
MNYISKHMKWVGGSEGGKYMTDFSGNIATHKSMTFGFSNIPSSSPSILACEKSPIFRHKKAIVSVFFLPYLTRTGERYCQHLQVPITHDENVFRCESSMQYISIYNENMVHNGHVRFFLRKAQADIPCRCLTPQMISATYIFPSVWLKGLLLLSIISNKLPPCPNSITIVTFV